MKDIKDSKEPKPQCFGSQFEVSEDDVNDSSNSTPLPRRRATKVEKGKRMQVKVLKPLF